ncbi:DNA replication and repair protein RecO [Thalassoporum mexicanum PCC 7367]|uniref:DNA repair protein RecO n=1 Tax=Thalassoporum mexicanum TaxID=3457544 RepID=UPI00029F8719|nr:DNA repair protein RecO [Pseudanabaena sp. PCC 7367]AFY71858.1 DNA replication and repair protein RecO [Pseudanabaena sp. PCC 7367]
MGRTYKATGINLKGMALGENDKLLTILTREHGLVRAVAAGARKHRSSLAGRSGLFVVNNLAIAAGRSLDRITQADTVHSFVGLSQNLAKLTAAQYLIELTLIQALAAQPQEELFLVIVEHLLRLNNAAPDLQTVMALLSHGIYHLLAVAGLAPQVYRCCISKVMIQPQPHVSKSNDRATAINNAHNNQNNRPNLVPLGYETDATDGEYRSRRLNQSAQLERLEQKFGFSIANGGVVSLDRLASLSSPNLGAEQDISNTNRSPSVHDFKNYSNTTDTIRNVKNPIDLNKQKKVSHQLTNPELTALQLLPQAELSASSSSLDTSVWLSIERLLRAYTKYHFDKPIQSADLIDSCFNSL